MPKCVSAYLEFRRVLFRSEGRESCGLDDDEISRIFNQEYTVLFRVFNHTGVHGIVHDFADTFKRRRIMSRLEILEALRALSTL